MLREDLLESGIPEDHIISMSYTSEDFDDEWRSLSVEAVYSYLTWLEKAFIIYRCQRYDLQGKSVLKTQEKFYLADASLKYRIMGFNPKSIDEKVMMLILEKKEQKRLIFMQYNEMSIFMYRYVVNCQRNQIEKL